MSHNSVGLQGLYQGYLYFVSFLYADIIGSNITYTVYVAFCADLFVFVLFLCLLFVMFFCVIYVFVCM
jgi:hypothetical protein